VSTLGNWDAFYTYTLLCWVSLPSLPLKWLLLHSLLMPLEEEIWLEGPHLESKDQEGGNHKVVYIVRSSSKGYVVGLSLWPVSSAAAAAAIPLLL
jgi:hypothetical protein